MCVSIFNGLVDGNEPFNLVGMGTKVLNNQTQAFNGQLIWKFIMNETVWWAKILWQKHLDEHV